MKQSAEERALELLSSPVRRLPLLARRFAEAYADAYKSSEQIQKFGYSCVEDLDYDAFMAYAVAIERLRLGKKKDLRAPMPAELRRQLNDRNRIMRKFLAKYHNLERTRS